MGQPEASAVYNHRHILILKFKQIFYCSVLPSRPMLSFSAANTTYKTVTWKQHERPFKTCTFTWGGQSVKFLLPQFSNKIQPGHGKSLTKAVRIFLRFMA